MVKTKTHLCQGYLSVSVYVYTLKDYVNYVLFILMVILCLELDDDFWIVNYEWISLIW